MPVAIGTGEFGSNGIIQLFAADMGISIPHATYAVTALLFGWDQRDPTRAADGAGSEPNGADRYRGRQPNGQQRNRMAEGETNGGGQTWRRTKGP